jgi:hypothetical protein
MIVPLAHHGLIESLTFAVPALAVLVWIAIPVWRDRRHGEP